MKKMIALVALLMFATLVLCSCDNNPQTIRGNRVTRGVDYQTFQYAYIILGDKLIAEGQITQWRDYQSGDEIQIQIGDKVFLTHYNNVVMVTAAGGKMDYASYQDYSSN